MRDLARVPTRRRWIPSKLAAHQWIGPYANSTRLFEFRIHRARPTCKYGNSHLIAINADLQHVQLLSPDGSVYPFSFVCISASIPFRKVQVLFVKGSSSFCQRTKARRTGCACRVCHRTFVSSRLSLITKYTSQPIHRSSIHHRTYARRVALSQSSLRTPFIVPNKGTGRAPLHVTVVFTRYVVAPVSSLLWDFRDFSAKLTLNVPSPNPSIRNYSNFHPLKKLWFSRSCSSGTGLNSLAGTPE